MASIRPQDLHPYLANAYTKACDEFYKIYPFSAQPVITATYRSTKEQDDLYAQGRTTPGTIVTNVKGEHSLHIYHPSFAFDIAFIKGKAEVDWNQGLFENFALIFCKDRNLQWGGGWEAFKDIANFGFKNFTWEMAAAGLQPSIIEHEKAFKYI